MTSPRFAFIGNQELSAVFRGRSVPIERLEQALKSGLPWVPTNVCISASNSIPPDNPFGPMGETRLVADTKRHMTLPARGERPATAVYLADITQHDGTFWEACARSQLKRALADLEETGYKLKAGFEHECYITGLSTVSSPAYSLAGTSLVSELAAEVFETLATAGARLDQFMAEYGHHQFGVLMAGQHIQRRWALGAQEDRQITAQWMRDRAQGFAEIPRTLAFVGQGIVRPVVRHRPFSRQNLANDPDVLPGSSQRLAERLSVPTLDDLRTGDAEAEDHAAV